MKCAVVSNHSSQFLGKAIEQSLFNSFGLASVYEAPFGNWEITLNQANQEFIDFEPAVTVICLSSNFFEEEELLSVNFITFLKNEIKTFKSWYRGDVFITSLDYPEIGILDDGRVNRRVNEINKELYSASETIDFYYVDLTNLFLRTGYAVFSPGKYLGIGGFGYHPKFYPRVAKQLAASIVASNRRTVRLIVVDLDNTLWRGILGEVGWEGIEASNDGVGASNYRLQLFLLQLHEKGTLLAIASKNDERLVIDAFENRTDFPLSLHHFSVIKANWGPKSESLGEIFDELNLTVDGTLFLDDSKFEREEVLSAWPDVIVPELPDDPDEWALALSEMNLFEMPRVSDEDKKRNDFYRVEKIRKVERAKTNPEQFLKNLQLKIKIKELSDSNSERALTLINKTNQFNVNGSRIEKSDFQVLLNQSNVQAFSYSLSDKHSDYGEIAVCITEVVERESAIIQSLVLSCRAFGRSVEEAIITHQSNLAASSSVVNLQIEFMETPKNKVALRCLHRLGFSGLHDPKNSGPSLLPVKKGQALFSFAKIVV